MWIIDTYYIRFREILAWELKWYIVFPITLRIADFLVLNKDFMHNVFMHTRILFFMEGYCVKCKQKRMMNDEKKITMKNGKPATQGICSTCGTKMFRIGK